MATWTSESREYFNSRRDAQNGARWALNPYRICNGVRFDEKNGKWYVSYTHKY